MQTQELSEISLLFLKIVFSVEIKEGQQKKKNLIILSTKVCLMAQ